MGIFDIGTWLDGLVLQLCVIVDGIFYTVLNYVYQVFFSVATINLLSGTVVIRLFDRIQLLIGVFVVFKLIFSAINGLINPDAFVDKKSGVGNIVTRILMSLVMLLMVIPINIPDPSNSFEIQVNNNGLLFGTLFTLQDRILYSNTIGKLILGTPAPENLSEESEEVDNNEELSLQNDAFAEGADSFVTSIAKSFIVINKTSNEDGVNDYWCKDDSVYNNYNEADNYMDLVTLIDDKCENEAGLEILAYNYIPFVPTLVCIFLIFCFIFFTFEIAVRTFNLMVLRLVAPIPIISYISPKSAKDGSFASWVKALITTYLDLFVRLIIVYLGLFLVNSLFMVDSETMLQFARGNAIVVYWTIIFLVVGVFIFMLKAPKFIRDVLGLKGVGMSNMALSALMGGLGSAAASKLGGRPVSASAIGMGMLNSGKSQLDAYNQGKQAPGLATSFMNAGDKASQYITGNDRMSFGRMAMGGLGEKGFGPLSKMHASDAAFEQEKGVMYALEDEAARSKNMFERAANGKLNNDQMFNAAKALGLQDVPDASQFSSDDARNSWVNDNKDRITEGLQRHAENASTNYGKQKKKVEDMTKFRDYYGRDDIFEYKYRERTDDNYNPGREDIIFAQHYNAESMNTEYVSPDSSGGKPTSDNRTYGEVSADTASKKEHNKNYEEFYELMKATHGKKVEDIPKATFETQFKDFVANKKAESERRKEQIANKYNSQVNGSSTPNNTGFVDQHYDDE